jgi:hypothetical protein
VIALRRLYGERPLPIEFRASNARAGRSSAQDAPRPPAHPGGSEEAAEGVGCMHWDGDQKHRKHDIAKIAAPNGIRCRPKLARKDLGGCVSRRIG